jgi:hypothetical protein
LEYSSRRLQTTGRVGSESSPAGGGGATVGEPVCAAVIAPTKRIKIPALTKVPAKSLVVINISVAKSLK